MRIIRLLLPLLAVMGAVFSRKRKTPSNPTATTSRSQPDLATLIDQLATATPTESAIKPLLAYADTDLTDAQCAALASRRNDLVPMLLHVVEDGKTELRENAVRLLGIIGGDAARDAAITALADYSFWVRGAAAEALGRIADPSTVMHLAKALTDPELYVHERAWDALTKIGGQEAEEVLTAWENQKSVSARSTKRKQRSPTRMDFEITEDYE